MMSALMLCEHIYFISLFDPGALLCFPVNLNIYINHSARNTKLFATLLHLFVHSGAI